MKKINWNGGVAHYLNLLRLEVLSTAVDGGEKIGWRVSGVTGVLDEEVAGVVSGTLEARAAVTEVARKQCEAQARHRLGRMTGVPELAVSSQAVLTLLDSDAPALAVHSLRCALGPVAGQEYMGDNPDARQAFIDLTHQIESAV